MTDTAAPVPGPTQEAPACLDARPAARPDALPGGSTMATIRDRGALVVGVPLALAHLLLTDWSRP